MKSSNLFKIYLRKIEIKETVCFSLIYMIILLFIIDFPLWTLTFQVTKQELNVLKICTF